MWEGEHVVFKCPSVPKPFLRDESPKKQVRPNSPEKVTTSSKGVWVSKTSTSLKSSDSEKEILKPKPIPFNDMNHPRLNGTDYFKEQAIKATKVSEVTPPPGRWIEVSITGPNGKPKTEKAWVPQLN